MFSQENEVVTFRLKKKLKGVRISKDTLLWTEKNNLISITELGGTQISKVFLEGGKIGIVKDSIYSAIVSEGTTAVLSVFEKDKQGKDKLISVKQYHIKSIPLPDIFVCGVKADSVIDKQQLLQFNEVTAYSKYFKTKVPVLGFDVIFSSQTGGDTLHSKNKNFTINMRNKIHLLKPGDVLQFTNIVCRTPDGKERRPEDLLIYIDETNKYKVGTIKER